MRPHQPPMGREAVAQRVQCHILPDPGRRGRLMEQAGQTGAYSTAGRADDRETASVPGAAPPYRHSVLVQHLVGEPPECGQSSPATSTGTRVWSRRDYVPAMLSRSRPSTAPLGFIEPCLLRKSPPGVTLCEHLEADGEVVFRHACKMGLEGIVSKRRDSRYSSGISPNWIKSKNPASAAVLRESTEDS
jgi:hypothetical protein